MPSHAPTPSPLGALSAADLVPDRALVEGDRDDFKHGAIAHRLADLVTEADTPLNVALFGAWGSGKSSTYELLRRALLDKPGKVALVRYDAWKYGGESLQRNFISHAANELGFVERDARGEFVKDNRVFHRGLYEKQRSADVDFKKLNLRSLEPARVFAATFTIFVAVFSVLLGAASLLTEENFLGQIGATLPKVLGPAGLIAAVVVAAKAVLDGATVEVEQSQPAADEEFGRVFRELRDKARKKGHSRLIFFVDELDRCAPDDVVKTLTALRTFLDQEDCVFIVAADREVLEKALSELPQVTPLDEENPYYSSASSFLDKVFQHQLVLPPLRGRRLTRFARDLVKERGGIWQELRAAENNGRLLDRVIYALIPSHVRSPRRVKVLLNNFATTARIAQSRDVAWLERSREIAKLTVLQTEFPLLAADLPHEPRLPSYLLEPPLAPSDRTARLLKRHGGTVRTSATSQEESPAALTDAVLSDEVDDPESGAAAVALLAETEQRLLRRYLERVQAAGIPDPGRDLLYLEAAGAAVGLADPALGELIENEAPDAPRRVVDALAARTVEERQSVARVLADMADQEFGDERTNVMSALLGTAQLLDDDVGAVADNVLESVRSYQREQQLNDQFLVSTLGLALRSDVADEDPLVPEILDDERLFATVERTGEVATMLDRIPARHRETVYTHVAGHLPDATVLSQPLRHLPVDSAIELLNAAGIQTELKSAVTASDEETDVVAFAEALYASVLDREDGQRVALALQRKLVFHRGTYPAVRAHAEALLDASDVPEGTEVAVVALDWAPPKDWDFWSSRIPQSPPDASETLGGWVADAAASILGKLGGADEDEAVTGCSAMARLTPLLRAASDAKRKELRTALETALNANTWWVSEADLNNQARLHGAARELAATGGELGEAIEELLAADVERALVASVVVAGYQRPASTQATTLRGVRVLGAEMSETYAARLLLALRDVAPPGDAERDTALTRARIALAKASGGDGAKPDFAAIPFDEVQALVQAGTQESRAGLAEWFELQPDSKQVLLVIEATNGKRPRQLVTSVGDWAGGLDDASRTRVVQELLKQAGPDPDWVRAVAQHGIDDYVLTEQLAGSVESAGNADQREQLIDLIVALSPGTHRSQKRVADLVVGLLATGTKVDFKLALKAVDALGTQHRSAERLRTAFKNSHAKNNHQVPAKSVEALARAGIKLPQKTLAEAAIDVWRGLRGG